MTKRTQEAIEDLLRMWDRIHSDDPISEIWDELKELSDAYKSEFFPSDVAGCQ